MVCSYVCLLVQRDSRRPPIPRKDHGVKPEEQPLLSNHPYVDTVFSHEIRVPFN